MMIGQKAVLSNPGHMMALPPEKTGAHRLRTMPPTWKSGIMFTEEMAASGTVG